jgi:hypothetical protein
MSKFLLNQLLQISKALVNLKIQFLSEKKSSSTFGPIGPVAEPAHPAPSGQAGRASPPGRASPLLLPPAVRRQCRRLHSRRHAIGATLPLSHTMEHRNEGAPLLNSVMCFYSAVNTPLFTTGNRRLHGRPLKPSAPPPPSGPIKGGGLHRFSPHSFPSSSPPPRSNTATSELLSRRDLPSLLGHHAA